MAGRLGVDISAYSVGYVAGWSGGDLDLIRLCADNVTRPVHVLAAALEPVDAIA